MLTAGSRVMAAAGNSGSGTGDGAQWWGAMVESGPRAKEGVARVRYRATFGGRGTVAGAIPSPAAAPSSCKAYSTKLFSVPVGTA